MRTAALSAGMAFVLLSCPAASQTLGTGHKPGAAAVGTGLARHTGGAVPGRFTALGGHRGHTGLGVISGACSIGMGVVRPAAVAVPSGLTVLRGAAVPSPQAVPITTAAAAPVGATT